MRQLVPSGPTPTTAPSQSVSALKGTNGNLPKKKKRNTVKYHHTLPRLPESSLQQNNFLRPSCERECGVMHDGGGGGGQGTRSRHTWEERKKTVFHRNQQPVSICLAQLPSFSPLIFCLPIHLSIPLQLNV